MQRELERKKSRIRKVKLEVSQVRNVEIDYDTAPHTTHHTQHNTQHTTHSKGKGKGLGRMHQIECVVP